MDYTPWFIFVNIIKTVMNKANKYFNVYEDTANFFIKEARKYGDDFLKKPNDEAWSLAQMYSHIALVTDKCLDNIDLCKNGEGKQQKFALGPAIFSLMGSFPPFKMHIHKIPNEVAAIYNPQAISIDDAITSLENSIKRMKQYIPIVNAIPKNQRAKHWAGGWFTALQWYQSAEMHIRHHLRQKKRIDVYIKNKLEVE